jgi:hypothetical protein
MKTRAIVIVLGLLIPVAGLAQTYYTEDFEGIAPVDGSMAAAGWLCYNNFFDENGVWYWGAPFSPIVNNVGNICDIVTGEGGPPQETQQLVVYSNYWDGAHQNPGHVIETNVYREWTSIGSNAGTWFFTFDAKMGNLVNPPSEALAFIKVLDPNAGYTLSRFETADMTNTPVTWQGYQLSVDLTGLDGQILQIGFLNNSSEYSPCAIFYDNLAFSPDGIVPSESATWGKVKTLYR